MILNIVQIAHIYCLEKVCKLHTSKIWFSGVESGFGILVQGWIEEALSGGTHKRSREAGKERWGSQGSSQTHPECSGVEVATEVICHPEEMEPSWDTPASVRHWLGVASGCVRNDELPGIPGDVETKDDCAKEGRSEPQQPTQHPCKDHLCGEQQHLLA